MPSAVIRSGICGFTIRATAHCEDAAHVALKIESDCPNYQNVAEQLNEVDVFQELFVDKFEGTVWKVCTRYSPHISCPVPGRAPQVDRSGCWTGFATNSIDRNPL